MKYLREETKGNNNVFVFRIVFLIPYSLSCLQSLGFVLFSKFKLDFHIYSICQYNQSSSSSDIRTNEWVLNFKIKQWKGNTHSPFYILFFIINSHQPFRVVDVKLKLFWQLNEIYDFYSFLRYKLKWATRDRRRGNRRTGEQEQGRILMPRIKMWN